VLAREKVVLDLERKIECFLGLGVLRQLQMGIDEIIERWMRSSGVPRSASAISAASFALIVSFQRPSST